MPTIPDAPLTDSDISRHHLRQLRAVHNFRLHLARTRQPWPVAAPQRPCPRCHRGGGAKAGIPDGCA
jgi:hypothetical protein